MIEKIAELTFGVIMLLFYSFLVLAFAGYCMHGVYIIWRWLTNFQQ